MARLLLENYLLSINSKGFFLVKFTHEVQYEVWSIASLSNALDSVQIAN